MIDKGRIRRGPAVLLAGLGGTGLLAGGIWLAAGTGTPTHAKPVAAQGALSHRTPSAAASPLGPSCKIGRAHV
nr:hypothetical protein [Actinomadura fibrosa]